jgi:hypothetical protein
VATIGGQSGGAKSFIAIDLGVHLIPDCNQDFYIHGPRTDIFKPKMGYRIRRHGGVLYFVLEGKLSFPLRVTAAFEAVLNKQMTFGERGRLPFAWNTYSPNLFEKGPDALIRLARASQPVTKMRTEVPKC